MDDLDDLQARVAAAQEKLRLNADDQRKYGLRLNDVVTIVEGSLSRQQEEMKRLQDAAVALRLESDAARVAESQAKNLYEAALVRLNQFQAQNEQLRNMVLTLLNVIEGREAPSALQAVVQRLESTVIEAEPAKSAGAAASHAEEAAAPDDTATEEVAEPEPLVEQEQPSEDSSPAEETVAETTAEAETAALTDEEEIEELAAEDEVIAEADDLAPVAEAAAAQPAAEFEASEITGDATDAAAMSASAEMAEAPIEDPAQEMLEAVEEDVEAEGGDIAAAAEDMPEDLGELSMNGHRDFVTDADEIVANEADAMEEATLARTIEAKPQAAVAVQPAAQSEHQDETLVTALLDAEKALIEAGASGVANANSPVAEIIRRISLRTREFSEASGV